MASKEHSQTPDRIHLLSIFHSKISELKSEMQRLKRETDSSIAANQLSQTVEDLRNELEDYNMARMNSFCNVSELNKEIDDLYAHNQQLERTIDELEQDKQKKEKRIEQLEEELSGEKTEISILENQLRRIRNRTADSTIHQEAFSLIDEISELESVHDQFLADHPILPLTAQFDECFNEIETIQKRNCELLSSISRTLIPTNSNQHGIEQYRKLKQDFLRLENLDQNLIEELRELRTQFSTMQEDIARFDDLNTLKHQAERRKQQLTLAKINMPKQKLVTQMEIETLQSQFEILHTQLQANQTYQQLLQLEQKLQTLDEPPSPHELIKQRALALVHAHNQWLIDRLKPST